MEHVKWQNKMNSIPIKEDVDDSWKEMEALLNHYHPVMEFTTASKGTLKVIIAKLASMLGYVLPAAAMITVGTYVITPKTSENKRTINSNTRAPKKQQIGTPLHQTPDTALKEKDTLSRLIVVSDSLKQFKMERVPLRMRVRKSVEGDKYKDNGYAAANQPDHFLRCSISFLAFFR